MPPETVLVVGASGLVGAAAVRALADRGHTVRALLRRPDEARNLPPEHVLPVVGDLTGTVDWPKALEGVTAVVDAVQFRVPGRLTVAHAREAAEVRRRMATNLLEGVRAHAPALRVFVALSGLEDYVPTGDAWFDESTGLAPAARGYSLLSVHARALLARSRQEWGLPLVTLRMGLIYGSTGWFAGIVDRIRHGRATLVGPGTNFNSLVAATDVGHAIRAAVERAPAGREYLVTDDEPLPQSGWQTEIATALHLPPVRRRVPVWLAALAVGRVNAETFAGSRRARNRRAMDELAWRPSYPTVREGFPAVLRTLATGDPP
jgi:nucleoside-diphosphate-sugar epimerase